MKTKPKPPVKLPKGRVSVVQRNRLTFSEIDPLDIPPKTFVAVLPCRNRQEAREIVRLRKMSRIKLINLIAPIIHVEEKWAKTRVWSPPTVAQRVLQALHLIP